MAKLSKKLFLTTIYILIIMLSGCVSYQENGNQGNNGNTSYIEEDSSTLRIVDNTNKSEDVLEKETEQPKEEILEVSHTGDIDSFADDADNTALSQRCGTKDESDIFEDGSELYIWKGYVNPTINNDSIGITIEKKDHSVYSEGYLVGDFFYEKPYISSGSTATDRINDYFCREYKRFTNGSYMSPDSDSYEWINELLEEFIESRGAEAIAIQPFTCNVVTRLTFFSEEYISFWQTYRWWATGPRDTWNFGVTFSMKTGELVPFTEFVDIEANTFKKSLCDVLLPMFVEYGQKYVYETYFPNNDNTFMIKYFDIEVSLDTSYFYDGNSIFLTLNHGLYPHDGIIIQWDDTMHTPNIIEYDGTTKVLDYP